MTLLALQKVLGRSLLPDRGEDSYASVREPGAAPDRRGLSATHLGIGCVISESGWSLLPWLSTHS